MTSFHAFLLLSLLVLAVLVLALVAARLWYRVWRQQRARHQARQRARQAVLLQLDLVSQALCQQQMNVTEAALRLQGALHQVDFVPQPSVDLAAVHALAEAAADLHVGLARRRLAATQRWQEDRRREGLEARWGQAVMRAAAGLQQALPTWRQSAGLPPGR